MKIEEKLKKRLEFYESEIERNVEAIKMIAEGNLDAQELINLVQFTNQLSKVSAEMIALKLALED